jgi:hypothetical protein
MSSLGHDRRRIYEITIMCFSYTEASLWTILSKCQLRGYALFIIFRGYAHNKLYDDLGITFI